jgi:hypothetical protein
MGRYSSIDYISPEATIKRGYATNQGHYTKDGKKRKRRFPTEVDAMIALATIRGKGRARSLESRYYQCPTCDGWHLTSEGRG